MLKTAPPCPTTRNEGNTTAPSWAECKLTTLGEELFIQFPSLFNFRRKIAYEKIVRIGKCVSLPQRASGLCGIIHPGKS